MLNVENVATPLTAFTLVVPASVPPPGSAPSATVINPVKPVTTFPASSSADTRTAGIVCPACVVCGCVVKATCVAGGGGVAVMVKLALVAPVGPLALADTVTWVVRRVGEDVATPLTAFTLVIPGSVPPPGSAPSATVINPVNPVTRFPASSSAATRTAGIVCPACVVCGCVVKATWVAGGGGAAVMLKLALVAPVSPLALAVNV